MVTNALSQMEDAEEKYEGMLVMISFSKPLKAIYDSSIELSKIKSELLDGQHGT